MWLALEYPDHEALGERLHGANAVTSGLFSEIVQAMCRHPAIGRSAKAARIEKLAGAQAWADAALALIDLELPQWQLRRIAYDGGEWHCALSRERELPEWLDRSIEAHHADLPLAILIAFVEAQHLITSSGRPSVPAVRSEAGTPCVPLCCDNFG